MTVHYLPYDKLKHVLSDKSAVQIRLTDTDYVTYESLKANLANNNCNNNIKNG